MLPFLPAKIWLEGRFGLAGPGWLELAWGVGSCLMKQHQEKWTFTHPCSLNLSNDEFTDIFYQSRQPCFSPWVKERSVLSEAAIKCSPFHGWEFLFLYPHSLVYGPLQCTVFRSHFVTKSGTLPATKTKAVLLQISSPVAITEWDGQVSTGRQMPTEISLSPQESCFLTRWNRSKSLPDLEADIPLLLKCKPYATILGQALF